MTIEYAQEIVAGIKFLNHKFEVGESGYLRITFTAPDSVDRSTTITLCQAQSIDLQSIDSPKKLLTSIFAALLIHLEHEASELFLIHGQDVFNEHNAHYETESKWKTVELMLNP